MNEANKIKLGAFLLISTILLVTAFISAGILRFLSPKIHAMTEVYTSVEGLVVGSPVKYLGMPVGKVTGMNMRGSDGKIIIYFDIFGEAFTDDLDPQSADGVFDQYDLDKMISQNMLNCFVNASGLMGGSHLELVRHERSEKKQEEPNTPARNIPPGVSYIPSSPSHIGNAIQNVSRMLEEMKSIDWNGFAEKINGSLDNLNSLLNKQELNASLERFARLGESLEQTAARLERVVTQENIDRINIALTNLNTSAENFLKATTSDEIKKTISNFNTFLLSATQTLAAADKQVNGVRSDVSLYAAKLEESLIRLENNLGAINRIIQDFNKDPGQIVHGRREPEVR